MFHDKTCILIRLMLFSVEVIVRAEAVERAQAGDKCDFTGSLIVVPDVASISMPGARAETSTRGRGPEGGPQGEGVSGLKALGVRDLAYRLAFLACHVKACNRKVIVGNLTQLYFLGQCDDVLCDVIVCLVWRHRHSR